MFRKAAQYRTELREKMRGGSGTVKIEHLWEPKTEMRGANRMAARLILPPGASIGFHNHEDEEEIFFIVKGQAQALEPYSFPQFTAFLDFLQRLYA